MNHVQTTSLRTATSTPPVAPIALVAPIRPHAWLTRIGRLFPRNTVLDSVSTLRELEAPPEAVWERIVFYEEVPKRPAPFLKLFLPPPVSTEGDKRKVGGLVRCTYEGGHLVKRITSLAPPSRMEFEVLEQHLGVEDCVSTTDGSYAIRAVPGGSEVLLTTSYHGHLRPRWLWRPFERYLAHQVHWHILEGMRAALGPALPAGGA
jgi:hypothetical protein